ncbi:MAG: ATP-binding cassette domain-containing protein [Phycisphaerales bacterium]
MPTSIAITSRAVEVGLLFGIDLEPEDASGQAIVPACSVSIGPGQILLITGPSGGGKSTLLRSFVENAKHRTDCRMLVLKPQTQQHDEHDQLPLIDCIDAPFEQALDLLARAGLAEASLLLRPPARLSDGQRTRFEVAQMLARAQRDDEDADDRLRIIAVDEFTATLDRLTAAMLCGGLRGWVSRTNCAFIAATAHDDVLEPLDPDVVIVAEPGGTVEVIERQRCTSSPNGKATE